VTVNPGGDGQREEGASPALRMREVVRRFGAVRALDGLSLIVPRGSICGLVGPNGAGKTTAMAVVCGFLRADEGHVDVLGQGAFRPERHRGRVSILPQDAELGRDMRLDEQLEYFGRLQGLNRGEARAEVDRVLGIVDLVDRRRSRTRTLSHGMLRRVAIGQAFLGDPELVLLDEPTNGLDPRQSHAIRGYIASQRGRRTIVVSSHNLHELETICDYVVLMESGRVIRQGRVDEFTGRDLEIRIELGEGSAVPLAALQAAFPEDDVRWQAEGRRLTIGVRPREGVEAEDIIAQALRLLLDAGARISAVNRGRSLERAYLESTHADESRG